MKLDKTPEPVAETKEPLWRAQKHQEPCQQVIDKFGLPCGILDDDCPNVAEMIAGSHVLSGPHRFQWTAWPPDSELPVLADNPYIEKETP